MKRLLCLILSVSIIMSAGTSFVLADNNTVLFSEDFNDYVGENVLPNGWTDSVLPETGVYSIDPVDCGYGFDTAMKIKAENLSSQEAALLKRQFSAIDTKEGIVKLSFQIKLEGISNRDNYKQTFSIYGGNNNALKGVTIVNGIVKYYSAENAKNASGSSLIWDTLETNAFLEENEWYTFDIVSDYTNNITRYYMNGNQLRDKQTGNVIETAATINGNANSSSVDTLYVKSRTKQKGAEVTDGGDIIVDNIVISNTATSGFHNANGYEFTEIPDELDIKFNNVINVKDFNEDEITVNAYAADDVLMTNASAVDFTIQNLSQTGVQIIFNSDLSLNDYEKIKVDFGNNKDLLGGKLSSAAFVKIPLDVKPQGEVIYDVDKPEESLVEVVVTTQSQNYDPVVLDYSYTENGVNKVATLYQSPLDKGLRLEYVMKDESDIFVSGYEYETSFRIKPIESKQASIDHTFNFVGNFDKVKKPDNTTLYNEGSVRWLYMSAKQTKTIAYFKAGTTSATKFNFDYKYNTDTSISDDVDKLFEANKWVDVTVKYNPDTKISSIFVETTGTNGQKLSDSIENYGRFLSTKDLYRYEEKYPNIDTSLIPGALKSLCFSISKTARVMIDDFKVVRNEIEEEEIKIKSVVFKDENGTVIQNNGSEYNAGANEILIYVDGDTQSTIADEISITGDKTLNYNLEYDVSDNVVKIDFGEEFLVKGDYTLSFPESTGLSDVAFSVGDGEITRSDIKIKTGDNTALACMNVKNTTDISESFGTLVMASYKNGSLFDVTLLDAYAPSGMITNIETNMVSTEGAELIKTFILKDNCLVAYREENFKTETSGEFAYTYTGNTDSEYVIALLMNPKADDNTVSYGLDDLNVADAFSHINVIKAVDGKYTCNFNLKDVSGKHTFYALTTDGEVIGKKEIIYSSAADRETSQQNIIDAVAGNVTSDAFETILENNSVELGLLENDLYENSDKEAVSKMLYDSIQKTPVDTLDNKDIQKRVTDICIIDAINNDKPIELKEYENYSNALSSEPFKTWFEKDLISSSSITERIDTVADEEDLTKKLMEALTLEIIESSKGYGNVKDLLELLSSELGIDTSKATLDTYRSMDGKAYADYSKLVEDFNILIQTQPSNANSGGGKGSGGRGSSGGVSSVIPMPQVTAQPLTEYVFDDIAGYDWAIDSITNLYKNGIVSGKGTKSFAPADNVLREEFVKMIVGAFEIAGTTDMKFADVSENDWFKPYIDKAYGAGIINGEGETFGVGRCITRQDMAKMIYEVALKKGKNLDLADISVFSDNGDISEYALDAVLALYKSGIVNGKDNAIFAPRDLATRAEAAVIISRAMNLIK